MLVSVAFAVIAPSIFVTVQFSTDYQADFQMLVLLLWLKSTIVHKKNIRETEGREERGGEAGGHGPGGWGHRAG